MRHSIYHSDLLNHNNYYTTLSSFVYHIIYWNYGAICYGVYIWLCKLLEGFPLITIVILIAGMVIGTATGLLIEYFVVSTDNGYYVTNWILSIVLCFIDVYLFNDDGLIAMCVAIGIKTVSLLVNCCYKKRDTSKCFLLSSLLYIPIYCAAATFDIRSKM